MGLCPGWKARACCASQCYKVNFSLLQSTFLISLVSKPSRYLTCGMLNRITKGPVSPWQGRAGQQGFPALCSSSTLRPPDLPPLYLPLPTTCSHHFLVCITKGLQAGMMFTTDHKCRVFRGLLVATGRQEDCKVEAILGSWLRSCLKVKRSRTQCVRGLVMAWLAMESMSLNFLVLCI